MFQRGCLSTFSALKLWQKIACGVIILLIVILAYFAISWVLHNSSAPPTTFKQKAEFERLVRSEYSGRMFNGTWISGN